LKKKISVQTDLLGNIIKEPEVNKIEDHWIDMPEYINEDLPSPKIITIVKFRNKKDFKEFNKLLKEHIYKKNLMFGRYKPNVLTLWYPPLESPSNYVYR